MGVGMFAAEQENGVYGFFSPGVHNDIPEDAVEISAERHRELLAGQNAGQIIVRGSDGFPLLIDSLPPSEDALAAVERIWRDQRLAETDGVVTRHRDEVDEGLSTTLTPEQYAELQEYRRALRYWPEAGEFPLAEHRPSPPSWLIGQLK